MDPGTVVSVVTDVQAVGDAITCLRLRACHLIPGVAPVARCSCPEDPGSACHACFQGNYRMGYRIRYSHHRGVDYGAIAESNPSDCSERLRRISSGYEFPSP